MILSRGKTSARSLRLRPRMSQTLICLHSLLIRASQNTAGFTLPGGYACLERAGAEPHRLGPVGIDLCQMLLQRRYIAYLCTSAFTPCDQAVDEATPDHFQAYEHAYLASSKSAICA